MVARYDFVELRAETTKEGWIKDKPVITRVGIFAYKKPDGTVVREFRSDEEVFHTDSLASLRGVPVTNNHSGLVTANNHSNIIGSVLSQGERQDDNVVAEVIIHNPVSLGPKRDLSMGYVCDIDEAPGDWNGQRYDCKQVKIRYNHLAVVNKGRAGNARLRLDSTDAVNGDFDTEDKLVDTKLVMVRLDGIDYQAAPEVNNALTKAQEGIAALQKRFDTLEAERDTLKEAAAKHSKELKAAKDQARENIRSRLELENTAGQHKVKFDEDDSDREIKEKILVKLRPELKLDGKSDDYIASAFDLTMEKEQDRTKKVAEQLGRFDKSDNNDADDKGQVGSAQTARQRYIARLRGEDKKDNKAA